MNDDVLFLLSALVFVAVLIWFVIASINYKLGRIAKALEILAEVEAPIIAKYTARTSNAVVEAAEGIVKATSGSPSETVNTET